mmetsp:Transcript_15177/g.23425  ORF Transcript_15177/g.23425 Transcript_15177/m.23425 type:complete len:235 (-) Transcript_15177:41-745(-)
MAALALLVRTRRAHVLVELLLQFLDVLVDDGGIRHHARESEVANLHVTSGVDQEVARLQIAVDDVRRVQEVESAELVVEDGYDVLLFQLCFGSRVQELSEVSLHVLHHNEQERDLHQARGRRHPVRVRQGPIRHINIFALSSCFRPELLGVDYFNKLRCEYVLLDLRELPEYEDLPVSESGLVDTLEDVLDELDSIDLARLLAAGLDDLTVGALSKEFDEVIFGSDVGSLPLAI